MDWPHRRAENRDCRRFVRGGRGWCLDGGGTCDRRRNDACCCRCRQPMRSAPALPYLLPEDDAVQIDPWRGADGVELEGRVEHWDPFTDLELLQVVTVDLDRVRRDAEL